MVLRGRKAILSLPTLLLLSVTTNVAVSQQPQKLQPLGDVLLLMMDKNKDQKVTMEEVNSQMTMLEELFQQGDGQPGEEENENLAMVQGAKAVAPHMFQLLDSNGDQALSKSELAYTTKFEKSLKKGGGFREFIRECFALLDTDGDDRLSVDEVLRATTDGPLSSLADKLHALFPLRPTAGELHAVLRLALQSIGGTDVWNHASVEAGIRWIDADRDGYIQRKEVGSAYATAGKKFLETTKTIKTMGPMLAMFGGGDMGMGMEF